MWRLVIFIIFAAFCYNYPIISVLVGLFTLIFLAFAILFDNQPNSQPRETVVQRNPIPVAPSLSLATAQVPVHIRTQSPAAPIGPYLDQAFIRTGINLGSQQGQAAKNNLKRTSILDQRQSLPVYQLKNKLLRAIEINQILIVVGETGSGKSTQVTQYLFEAGYATNGKIACTQPRRVAAKSVATRVAQEYGCRLGETVGYKIRFENRTTESTRIKYMTDGMLLRECSISSNLSGYSVIILDEAHERTVHNDVLFALCKEAAKQRPKLKLIIASATLDAQKFGEFFDGAPIFEIPGRTFPVEIFHSRTESGSYFDQCVKTVIEIHKNEPPGDILLFLTGQEEIKGACDSLKQQTRNLTVCPIYAALSNEEQALIFEPQPEGHRKVIVGTNIAETSLTIDGIRYVVDSGFVKQKLYDTRLGLDILKIISISKAQAKQRTGRAGRTMPGKCYRVYTDRTYQTMRPDTTPEIHRVNLASTILLLKSMGKNDIMALNLLDSPTQAAVIAATKELQELKALDSEEDLTDAGRMMTQFPFEPALAKAVISSVKLGCSEEMATIAAVLTAASNGQNLFSRPQRHLTEADLCKKRFAQPEGDHTTFLAVYNEWIENNRSKAWCKENFLCFDVLKRAQDIREQIIMTLYRNQLDVVSCENDSSKIEKAIIRGFKRNVAIKDPIDRYRYITSFSHQPVYIHPSSVLFHILPEMVICHELVLTNKIFMREVCPVFCILLMSLMSTQNKPFHSVLKTPCLNLPPAAAYDNTNL